MNGHIHLKPAILSHEEKHYEKRIYSGQEFSFTASDCNYLGCCLCCPECQHGLHRRLYFQCRPQSYWCTDTPAGHLGTWQNKSTRRKKRIQASSDRKTLITGGICCGILLCFASNFQQFGIKYTSVGKAGFITACYIVIVPIIGIFLKKKCSPFIWIAVILSLCGLYLLCLTPGEGFAIGKGELLVLICAFLFSLHILTIDHFSPLVDGVKMSCIQFLVCGILSGIPALIFESPDLAGIFAAKIPVLYAGVMSCGVAYTLQIVGQKNMNPTVVSLILSLESCISVIAGWLILGQNLSSREIFGCVLMFGAIILAQLPQKGTAF